MTHPIRTFVIAALLSVGLAVPIASTAPAPGSERLAMANIPVESVRVLQPMPTPEEMLLKSLSSLRTGDTEAALSQVDQLLEYKPTFRLAHLVRGDILASLGGRPPGLVKTDKESRLLLESLVAEARQRSVGTTFEPGGRIPASLIQLAEHHQHAVFIDTELSRLYLFENREGDPVLVKDYYISIGKNGSGKRRKGDKRTPLGVYFVTEKLPGENLPDRYGPVAFPVNYPNEWDRRNHRTGSGIWLHGVASKSYSRPPQDSDGCVALINEEIEQISPLLQPGLTPVVIGNNETWLEYQEMAEHRSEVAGAIEQWRTDWESGDVERYLTHYDNSFKGKGMNIDRWRDYKRRVSKHKKNISVDLDNVSIFGYPEEQDMITVTFRQHYESNNFNGSARKRQYWRKDDSGRWRIVAEMAATTG